MQDLIQITQTQINGADVNSVNARQIHEYLEVKTVFSNWIKRAIEKYDFLENEDFVSFITDSKSGKRDYIVSMSMAKELSMLENNPKGKETRKYFIEVEKQATQNIIPQNPMEALKLFFDVSEKQEERLIKLEATKRLENWQERGLTDAKNIIVYGIANDDKKLATALHRKVWSIFKKHFHLARYNELPAIKYEDGLSFIRNLSLADLV